MKNLNSIKFLMLVASSFMFMQCTSEYTAIPGADGVDGVDGVDGIGTQTCVACHANEHRIPIIADYELSGHGSGDSWARGVNNANCATCHHNQGLIDVLSGQFVDADGIPTTNPADGAYAVEEPISCTGCHSQHRSFDFENDGNDYAVRSVDAVHLSIDPTIQIDIRNSADALGLSNLCVNCHQPRNSYPIPAGTDDYAITSSRFGPHHGPQSTIFEGIMGANIPGAIGYPGVGSSAHRSGSSCVTCHMGESSDASMDGGHTWKATLNSCVACHSDMTEIPTEIAGYTEDLNALQNLLIENGALAADGSILGSSGSPNVLPVKVAQALWNWSTLNEDQSNGIHNPIYTRALLANSIEALQE